MSNTDNVYRIFSLINKIPRPSHHEERISGFICDFATKHGLTVKRDKNNCVCITKPATPGLERSEPMVMHAHCDMVCVSALGKSFNPETDAIEAYETDGWIKAKGTSLGADNGIGLAMALTIMADKETAHGPLELLVTTNEEDGMTGARNLDPQFVEARRMIDLDSEDFNTITVASAGALLQEFTLKPQAQAAPQGYSFYTLHITGGLGGHSGVDIDKGHESAVKSIATAIKSLHLSTDRQLVVTEIKAGEANASIASNARAVVGLPSHIAAHALSTLPPYMFATSTDPDVRITANECPVPVSVLLKTETERIYKAITSLPQGITETKRGNDGKNTVYTSNNIGILSATTQGITITTHTRSFSPAKMEKEAQNIADTLGEMQFERHELMNTHSWKQDTEHPFLKHVRHKFKETTGFEPLLVKKHFVTEMAYFTSKFQGMQIASIGPLIVNPHSVNEKVKKDTIEQIYTLLENIIKAG